MQKVKDFFSDIYELVVVGKQKALLGGFVAGALSLLGYVGITGDMTVKEALYAIGVWVITHGAIYFKANR